MHDLTVICNKEVILQRMPELKCFIKHILQSYKEMGS